jgi:hypothetical protein
MTATLQVIQIAAAGLLCSTAIKNAPKPLASFASCIFIRVEVSQGEKTRPILLLHSQQKQKLIFC